MITEYESDIMIHARVWMCQPSLDLHVGVCYSKTMWFYASLAIFLVVAVGIGALEQMWDYPIARRLRAFLIQSGESVAAWILPRLGHRRVSYYHQSRHAR